VIAAVVILVGCSLGALMIGIVGGSLAAPSINATATAEASSSGINSDTTQTSTQPAATGTWTTTHTFTGNGIQKTANFTAPDDWKILYSCAAQAVGDGTYVDGVLGVIVTGTDNTPIDVAVNATCKAGSAKTTGQTEEHQGGQVYLDINATGDWTVQIQELK
jgi:hypothetical protein